MSQLQLGAQLMGQRRFAAALECFRRARALGARGFEVDFGLGSALLDTRQEAAAIVELERAPRNSLGTPASDTTSPRRSTSWVSWTRRSPTSGQPAP
jgi:thioredoxin-like negative regulator of GroEL